MREEVGARGACAGMPATRWEREVVRGCRAEVGARGGEGCAEIPRRRWWSAVPTKSFKAEPGVSHPGAKQPRHRPLRAGTTP